MPTERKRPYHLKPDQPRCQGVTAKGSQCNAFPRPSGYCRHHETDRTPAPKVTKGPVVAPARRVPPATMIELRAMLARVAVRVESGELDHLTGQAVAALGRVALATCKAIGDTEPADELEAMSPEQLQAEIATLQAGGNGKA